MCMHIGTCTRAVKGYWMEDLMCVLKFACEFEGVWGVVEVRIDRLTSRFQPKLPVPSGLPFGQQ